MLYRLMILAVRAAAGLSSAIALLVGPAPATKLPPEPAPRSQQQFVVTEDTDVRLDGRPCQWADVPESASVLTLDLAADGKTVLRVFFRSVPEKGK